MSSRDLILTLKDTKESSGLSLQDLMDLVGLIDQMHDLQNAGIHKTAKRLDSPYWVTFQNLHTKVNKIHEDLFALTPLR